MKAKTRTYHGWTLITSYDDPNELPSIEKTRAECIRSQRSGHGHPCDDPRKRGVVCKVTITVEIPYPPPANFAIFDYVRRYEGHAGLYVFGYDRFNRQHAAEIKREQSEKLKRLRKFPLDTPSPKA